MRLFWFVMIVWGLYWVWRKLRAATPSPTPTTPTQQLMVQCAHCDVHVPQQHAVVSNEHWFCCQAHKDAFYSS